MHRLSPKFFIWVTNNIQTLNSATDELISDYMNTFIIAN